ncbi:ABC transporter [Mesotoga sp. Brook.08.YT.4.2.5.1]|uniref:ABC transporter permease n=1 Tax=unclassified Mesotoga TaxID=1184398 RepID=UPI000C99BEC4|nr:MULTISPECIES: ABC transporter permease [unclassified Mesotoga]PNE23576.1 ABC transporter [Mesotoga sp. Brook.08.YT.4.2.5.1]RAO95585.1 ABC transporter [Mesotoga sp. Brook.08.YT.4.2.5.4.]RDI90784.1 ABC transporter [Mesotoga sp. Brook.08.YT.4.2.5.2.]
MTEKRSRVLSWVLLGLFLLAFVLLISNMAWWESFLRWFFPGEKQVLHPRGTLLELVAEHLWMVIVSSGLATIIGISIGVLVTRPMGRQYLPLVSNLSSLGQTFPPVAVLALAVPLLGFGFKPTVAALLLYGLLPILRNTIVGIESIPADVREAAYGMGMSSWQVLFRIELPLALKVIMSGIRISVVINIGTATVGATIGAGGLGSPIIAGLVAENPAFVLEGAIPAALLAFSADALLGNIEKTISTA